MKKTIVICLLAAFALSSCSFVKGSLRVVNDLAESLCDVMGSSAEAAEEMSVEELCTPIDELDGFSLATFCAIHKPLSPFIRELLKANRDACLEAGADGERLGAALE